jgi:Family of unknown function (DUF6625)
MAYKIAILIPYFGDWPAWIDFFVESCRWNRDIDWILFNDRTPPENRVRNVRHVRIGFEDYTAVVSEELGIRFRPPEPYKLCEVRPALPYVHRNLVAGYDFVGTGDLDVIYGDIRSFYDDELLANYDLFSSHPDRMSGHFCLMRNREDVVSAFRRARGWKKAFLREDYVNFDERAFYNIFRHSRPRLFRRDSIRGFFREAYSTPGATDRMRWYWKDGRLTNEFYPHHPFMYLHFMSWHSNRWYEDQPGVAAETEAPWRLEKQIVTMDWRDARTRGFMISTKGIGPIEGPRDP